MTTNAPLNQPRDVATSPRRLAAFFALSLGGIWTLQLPPLLAQRGLLSAPVGPLMGLAVLGTFSPLVAALLLARGEPGGVRALFGRLRYPAGTGWLVGSLALFPACWLLAASVAHLLRAVGLAMDVAWLYPPENGQQLAALILIPIVEETGWRGYAQPRLQSALGPVRATLVLGVAWAAWHFVMFLSASTSWTVFAVSTANILVGAGLFTWLYNRTRGSLLAAMLAHAGTHLNNPSHAVPNPLPLALYTAAMGAVVLATWAFDRNAWRPSAAAPAPQA